MLTQKLPNARVLIVDDEPDILSRLGELVRGAGYDVNMAEGGLAALAVAATHPPDAVLTDVWMQGMDGLELLRKLHERDDALPVVMMGGGANIRSAVEAVRAGASDYLAKPIEAGALERVLARVLEHRQLEPSGLHHLIGASPPMQRLYRTARQVAGARSTVLLTGETGTGKGELARAIHALSPRASRPFVQVHCASLVDTLLESELFGHERGSFTGADRRRFGRFEEANGGTLFLDEVGELSPLMQVKLLRVLQERTFERVGSNEPIHVDVRLIAATNRDPAADVQAGRFREDLYYRLNVVHIEMPPLRDRGSDVITLAEHFLRRFALENHKRVDGMTHQARAKLAGYAWPGNVRALENTIERAVVLCEGSSIREDDLVNEEVPSAMDTVRLVGSTMAELERHAILKTLESCEGSTARAAELLQISVRTIQYRLHEYGLEPRSARAPWVPAEARSLARDGGVATPSGE